ncbi:PTS transporter subunit EIIC [Spiroplasma sp. ChiS]|uniref:PTS transporter subunit EIIC n=1 Tax=Spiroplasma sp. ChiS TaxID=2099885 RepID=UPI001F306F55|nr:PTS transporter subunit EIIC [Spiroplasma sp. ChiS]
MSHNDITINVLLGNTPISNFLDNQFWAKPHSQILYVFDFNVGDAIKGYGAKYNISMGVFGGILVGCLVALIYNKYSGIKLPASLGFFSGRSFVPMITAVYFLLGSFALAAIWPWFQLGLQYLGYGLGAIPPLGAFFYAIFNRLLLPFGLHQVLNTYLWFQQPIIGHLMNYQGTNLWQIVDGTLQWAVYSIDSNGVLRISDWNTTGIITTVNGDINDFLGKLYADAKFGLAGGSGIFQSGFFPMMMFGLPAACAAMILSIKDKMRRAEYAGILRTAAGVSFLTGITEPIEFSFVFLAPVLLGLHAVLAGLFSALTIGFGIRVGFGFSTGFIDWVVGREEEVIALAKSFEKTVKNNAKKKANQEQQIANINIVGSGQAGSENILTSQNSVNQQIDIQKDPNGPLKLAQVIYDAIGHDNLVKVDNCMTRLRLTVEDNTKIDQAAIKATGVAGLVLVSKTKGIQIIIGLNVEAVATKLSEISEK